MTFIDVKLRNHGIVSSHEMLASENKFKLSSGTTVVILQRIRDGPADFVFRMHIPDFLL
jgi:hypothetical protein